MAMKVSSVTKLWTGLANSVQLLLHYQNGFEIQCRKTI